MSSFFSSLTTKAQSVYEQSPLSSQVSHLQSKLHKEQEHGGAGSAEQPTANQSAAQGGIGAKSQVLGNITYQFRNLQMQYANVSPVQRIITSQKGVVLDFESAAKDAKSQSKELYMWGQDQDEDLKDVTDRLAYLNFVNGALSTTLASQLDSSRSAMKTLRNAEKELEPKRNNRTGLQTQIGRLEHDMQKGSEKRLSDLREQLAKLEAEDEPAEKEIEILKRNAVRQSERAKWAAIREYGEKLVLLAEASTSIIDALPSVPPSKSQPYTGAQSTAATRASLQQALDNFKPGNISHSFQPSVADINRSDSRSFGVTHASELSNIASPSLPGSSHDSASVPHSVSPQPSASSASQASPPPVNPTALNNAPAPIPPKSSPLDTKDSEAVPVASNVAAAPSIISSTSPPVTEATTSPVQIPEPTIAETGMPVSAGPLGPGPKSGSLKELRSNIPPQSSTTSTVGTAPKFETAEEEKARLQKEERERLAQSSVIPPGSAQKYDTAEEEKKRLEKEEKDRLLKEEQARKDGSGSGSKDADGDGATPPPYQDF
ncbi:LSP1 [Sanghuangporus vaninii]